MNNFLGGSFDNAVSKYMGGVNLIDKTGSGVMSALISGGAPTTHYEGLVEFLKEFTESPNFLATFKDLYEYSVANNSYLNNYSEPIIVRPQLAVGNLGILSGTSISFVDKSKQKQMGSLLSL
jgi:hypothetical protein